MVCHDVELDWYEYLKVKLENIGDLTMGAGSSIEEYMMDFDEEMPPADQRRKLEKDLRRGIYIHQSYGEFRIPRQGR